MTNQVITFGEIMLRLKSPGFERFFQSPSFEASFGGGEANVAVSLSQFDIDTAFVTALPDNLIADACINFLKSRNVNTRFIKRQGERMGVYFLEAGACQRSSKVVYDRAYSSISSLKPEDLDWSQIFENASWFHVTGITPAISQNAADITLEAVRIAKSMNLTVSCDYNYRKNLWKYGRNAQEVMPEIVKYVDIGIANEEDCQSSLGIGSEISNWKQNITSGEINQSSYKKLCEKMFEAFPNLKYQAITLRKSYNASHNGWAACLFNGNNFYFNPGYDIQHIVDRVGTGDSFAAAIIYALIKGMNDVKALSFATAASCLKHTIHGDMNLVTLPEILNLMNGDASGRVQR